jgi:hypothetical protein
MAGEHIQRRLAAILAADVVGAGQNTMGYSVMCDGNDQKTLTDIPQMPSNFVGFIPQSKRQKICFPYADIVRFT